MRHKRFAITGLAFPLIVGLLIAAPAAGAKPPASKPKLYKMKQTTFTFVDTSRATPANGSYAGAPSRTLVTVVSMPVGAKGKVPLVVFSTGSGGTATNYQGLYQHWVAAGYAVAAPNFPLSQKDAPGGSSLVDFKEQPADVRFVLTSVLKLAAGKKGPLAGKIDSKRVALAGKSLGAITTLTAAYNIADHDTREKAVISLTGAASDAKSFFTGIPVPLLLVHGDADKTVPYQSSVDAFGLALTPKYLVTLFGEDHGGAFDGEGTPAADVVVKTTTDFLDAYVKGQKAALTRLAKDGDVASVSSYQAAAG
ncbi:MAG: phospholipase/Carboxylesterase [Actinomycetia bacterium]|nr:phospholipase/Carboxylesterase [Actinomycetes bacterium]